MSAPAVQPPATPRKPSSGKAGFAAGVLLLGLLVFAWENFTGPSDENKRAGESIAIAVETFNQHRGRYPERLEELVPAYLAEIPQAGQFFVIVYAADPGGKRCWVAYQVHRDRLEEFDCRKREWASVDFEDSRAMKHPGAQKLMPALWRR